MLSNHLILCCLLLLPSTFPNIRVFSKESGLCIRWPKYWSFSISEYSGLISFRIDWFDLLAVQGTLKSLLQHHSSKASIYRPWYETGLHSVAHQCCVFIEDKNFYNELGVRGRWAVLQIRAMGVAMGVPSRSTHSSQKILYNRVVFVNNSLVINLHSYMTGFLSDWIFLYGCVTHKNR